MTIYPATTDKTRRTANALARIAQFKREKGVSARIALAEVEKLLNGEYVGPDSMYGLHLGQLVESFTEDGDMDGQRWDVTGFGGKNLFDRPLVHVRPHGSTGSNVFYPSELQPVE